MQQRAARMFAAGLRRHGLDAPIGTPDEYRPSDLAVFWSHRRTAIIAAQRARGLDYLVMERGYLADRNWWISLGFNGLNGRADFHNADVPADRFQRYHAHLMAPWREGGDYVLLFGQVRGDAALNGLDFVRWARAQTDALRAAGHRVRFRPHPADSKIRCPRGAEPSPESDLYADIESARFTVAHSSTASVQSVLSGVPVVCLDRGAMAWEVASHALAAPLIRPDRAAWAHRLAYCQWTPAEIAQGAAWAHLKRRYETSAAAEPIRAA
jgi:hypothetical protein